MGAHIITEKDPLKLGAEGDYPVLFLGGTEPGFPVTILAELLDIDYYVYMVDLAKQEEKEDWYVKMNPNGKTPALADVSADGKVTYVNESGAILLYLAQKYDKGNKASFAEGSKEYFEQLEWLLFALTGFSSARVLIYLLLFLSKNKDEYELARWQADVKRMFGVLEERFVRNGKYLAGDHVSLADVALFPYMGHLDIGGFTEEFQRYPHLVSWVSELTKIPAFTKGPMVGIKITPELLKMYKVEQ